MAKDKKSSPTQPSSPTATSSSATSPIIPPFDSSDTAERESPSPGPNGQTPREFALLAAKAFRAGEGDDGVAWLQEFACRYTDTRTDALIKAVAEGRYEDAAGMLEFAAGYLPA